MSNTVLNDEVINIIVRYLFYLIYVSVEKNEKVVIAIDEIWNMFDNKYLSKDFFELITKFSTNKNIIFVATTNGSDFFEDSFIKEPVDRLFKTNIILPIQNLNIYQKKIFNINEREAKMLGLIKEESNIVMIKHNKNIIFSSIKFDFLDDYEKYILCADNVSVNALYLAMHISKSNTPKIWAETYKEIIKQYIKYSNEKKLREQEERQIKWKESQEQLNMDNIMSAKKNG